MNISGSESEEFMLCEGEQKIHIGIILGTQFNLLDIIGQEILKETLYKTMQTSKYGCITHNKELYYNSCCVVMSQ